VGGLQRGEGFVIDGFLDSTTIIDMNRAITANEELSVGNGVKVLRPVALSFYKAFVQMVLIQFFLYGVIVALTLFLIGPLPTDWPEKLSLTALSIPLLALVISPLLLIGRRIDRMWHWEYDSLGLRIYFQDALHADIKWSQINKLRYRKKRITLRLERWWLVFGMSSISKEEYQGLRAIWVEYSDSHRA